MSIFQFFGKLSIVVFIVLVLLAMAVREFGTGHILAYDQNTKIMLVDVDHSLSHPLVIEPELVTNSPWSWSPDGQQLAFAGEIASLPLGSPDLNWDIYLLSMTNFQVRNLTQSPVEENGQLMVWSADGHTLAFVGHFAPNNRIQTTQFHVIDVESGQVIYQFSQPGDVHETGIVLSPDGITLAFAQSDDRPGTQLSVIKMDQQQAITQFSVSENHPGAGVLSPDGLWLAFQTTQDLLQTIWVMDTHTGTVHHVTEYDAKKGVTRPVWSPDSQYMAYTVWEGDEDSNHEVLYVMDTKTRQPHALTHHAGNDSFPAWSPDGRWLAVVSDRDRSQALYLINPLTGAAEHIISPGFPLDLYNSPNWSPDGQQVALIVWNNITISREIYLVDIANHSISYLSESNFLVWQP